MTVRLAVTGIDDVRDVVNPEFNVEWVGGADLVDLSSILADTTSDPTS